MKKFLVATLAIAVALPVAACGKHEDASANSALIANEGEGLGEPTENIALPDENAFAVAGNAEATADNANGAADNLVAGNAL